MQAVAKVVTSRRGGLHSRLPVTPKLTVTHSALPRTPHSLRHRNAALTTPAKTVLWIDDYAPALAVYQAIFENHGFRVLTATRPSVGLQLAATEMVDAVITDYEMPEMSGASVAIALKKSNSELPVILFSGSESLPRSITNFVDGYCDKAAPIERLIATVKHLIIRKPTPLPHPVQPHADYRQRVVA